MPSMAYFSPVVYDINPLNHIVYSITHIVADQKFMAIFSMLFGASTILFINSVKKREKSPLLLFYSRNFWLLILGWIHSTYLWYGDILFIYALCAFQLFFFKNITPKKQFILGCLIYLIPTFLNFATYTCFYFKLCPYLLFFNIHDLRHNEPNRTWRSCN